MDIYVIDRYQQTTPHFPIIGMIPAYHAIIWDIQLYARGYFELTVDATEQNVELLQEGRFVCRGQDMIANTTGMVYKNAMIIRKVVTTYDAEQGWLLIVSGKSTKDIISQRIIWDRYEAVNTYLTTVAFDLFTRNIIDPTAYVQGKIDALDAIISDLYDIRDVLAQNVSDAQDAYNAAVAQYGEDSPQAEAAKEVLDGYQEQLQAVVYELAIKNREQTYWTADLEAQEKRAIPYIAAGVLDYGFTPPRVTVQLRGENLGDAMEDLCTENHLGWEMLMTDSAIILTFTQGQDKTDTVIFSPEFDNLKNATYTESLETFQNAGLVTGGEYDDGIGPAPVAADVGTASGDARFELHIEAGDVEQGETTSYGDYYNMLLQYGNSSIIKHMKTTEISGEIDTDGVFQIGRDFNLGDAVTVQTEQGITASTRLIEIIYADESSGSSTTGTFEQWEV